MKHNCVEDACSICAEEVKVVHDELLAACKLVIAECDEMNAQEGLALDLSEKSEWTTAGYRAMVAAVKKAKSV
jgi:hypothetical protein